jgi:hypothetical protein
MASLAVRTAAGGVNPSELGLRLTRRWRASAPGPGGGGWRASGAAVARGDTIMSDIGTASSATSLWNGLLPVLAGGALALLGSFIGSVIGPFFIQRTKDATDRRRKRAEKCEELMGAVVEHYHWNNALRYFTISGQGNQPTLSPITKIQAIVGMYFPEFDSLALQFDTVSLAYERWILDMGQRRVRNQPGYDTLPGHDDVLPPYIAKRMEFLSALRDFARREFSERARPWWRRLMSG